MLSRRLSIRRPVDLAVLVSPGGFGSRAPPLEARNTSVRSRVRPVTPSCTALAKTRMANVVRDPREHPDAILPDLVEARSFGAFHQGRHRVRLWEYVETAIFQQGR